jgi:hypothetical protein
MTKRPPKDSKPRKTIKRADKAPSDYARPASDERPTHREDFNRLLNAAVQKPAPKD